MSANNGNHFNSVFTDEVPTNRVSEAKANVVPQTATPDNPKPDTFLYPLNFPAGVLKAIHEQPLNDVGHGAISKLVMQFFRGIHGAARANMLGRLNETRTTTLALRERRQLISAEYKNITGNNPVSTGATDSGSRGAVLLGEKTADMGLSRRSHRLSTAGRWFVFATAVTLADWVLGYSFCRATILNNGGSPFEAAVCGFPFATLPWGAELWVSLRADEALTNRCLRSCGRLLLICGALFAASFALDFAFSRDGTEPAWITHLSVYLPTIRLFAQLGIGSCVAFFAILKGMILLKTSRAEELLLLTEEVDIQLAAQSLKEKGIEGEIAVWDATQNFYVAFAQAEGRNHHLSQ